MAGISRSAQAGSIFIDFNYRNRRLWRDAYDIAPDVFVKHEVP
jgi:hypothetical protein